MLFLQPSTQDGSASNRFCTQMSELFKTQMDVVQTFIQKDRASVHGIQKGSGTIATSGITLPPSILSVANRGDWSMGKVLDVCWHFSEPGDTYLGRVLAGFDPSKPALLTGPFKIQWQTLMSKKPWT